VFWPRGTVGSSLLRPPALEPRLALALSSVALVLTFTKDLSRLADTGLLGRYFTSYRISTCALGPGEDKVEVDPASPPRPNLGLLGAPLTSTCSHNGMRTQFSWHRVIVLAEQAQCQAA
jgi:hypothetical protein